MRRWAGKLENERLEISEQIIVLPPHFFLIIYQYVWDGRFRVTMEKGNIKRQFAEFFRIRQKQSPERKNKFQLGPQKGWLEEIRAEAFSAPDFGDVSIKEGDVWSQLTAKIYSVESIGFLSAVLAYYDDNTIFWLDDHSSSGDFKAFVQNERLWTWLPEQKQDLIGLLLETKLNYFGCPRLINSVSDIPSFSKQELEQWSVDPSAQSEMTDAQQRVESVSERIAPPSLLVGHNQVFELSFFVWTKILGRIISARFEFGQDGLFLFEDNELVKMVGRFLVPR